MSQCDGLGIDGDDAEHLHQPVGLERDLQLLLHVRELFVTLR